LDKFQLCKKTSASVRWKYGTGQKPFNFIIQEDALVIADMVKTGYYAPVRFHSSEYEELRVLVANRETVVKLLVSAVNQIHRWVDIVFPELRQVFKILTCNGASLTLRLFPLPSDLYKLSPGDVI
jgi:transposase